MRAEGLHSYLKYSASEAFNKLSENVSALHLSIFGKDKIWLVMKTGVGWWKLLETRQPYSMPFSKQPNQLLSDRLLSFFFWDLHSLISHKWLPQVSENVRKSSIISDVWHNII